MDFAQELESGRVLHKLVLNMGKYQRQLDYLDVKATGVTYQLLLVCLYANEIEIIVQHGDGQVVKRLETGSACLLRCLERSTSLFVSVS